MLSHFTRALRLRCPNCGGGPVFVSWLKMCPSCPSCGLRFDREPEGGYWVGSNTINLFATEAVFALVFLGSLLATWPDPPWTLITWGDVILMIVFPVCFFPFSKTLFIAVDLTFRPREPGDFEQPREPAPRPSGRR
ncbi:MAG TPA: DUF983 domain-containing protein [Gemmatimonadales bacterium]|nr:DUF983 domain-containing protein [Gemmatimonadales bacterium]